MKKLIVIITSIAAIAAANAQVPGKTYDKAFIGSGYLYKEYDENPIAADAHHRYQTKTVVGHVKDIGRDIEGNPYIVLGGSDYFGGVQCMFTPEDEEEIAKLSKGQKLAISGEIKGLIFFNVLVSDCQFTDLPVLVKKAVAAR